MLMVLVLVPLVSIGQVDDHKKKAGDPNGAYNNDDATAMTEWKYCTIGYKTQMESGLDPIKKGYEINEVYTYSYFGNTKPVYVRFIEFVKTDTKKVKAVIVVVDNKNYNYDSYYCIPNDSMDNEVKQAYKKQNNNMVSSRLRLLLNAYSGYINSLR